MASFDCPTCNHKGTIKVYVYDRWNEKETTEERECPQCRGTGIVDNYGNSKSF